MVNVFTFIIAASPYVIMGLVIAFLAVIYNEKKIDEKKENLKNED